MESNMSTQASTMNPKSDDAVLGLLQRILELPVESRIVLRNGLAAMDGGVWHSEPRPSSIAATEDDKGDLAEFNSWLESLHRLPNREKITNLREAQAIEDDPEFLAVIEDEIARIKNSDRLLAVELALTDYAYQHPVMIVISLVGVVIGLGRFGKSLWHMIF